GGPRRRQGAPGRSRPGPAATEARGGSELVVLVIDTSSSRSALALISDDGGATEDVVVDGREHDLPGRVMTLVDPRRLTAVAVGLGPGSFTGLRGGVSYGVGLAMGLGIRLVGLASLGGPARGARAPVAAPGEGRP